MSWIAEDVMTRRVVCVYADMDLRDLGKLFLEKRISGAPVMSRGGSLSGVVSLTDLQRYAISREEELVLEPEFYSTARIEGRHVPVGFQIGDANTGTVADIMSPQVHSVTESTPVEKVAKLMRSKHIHRVIVERDGDVVGLISALDLVAVLYSPERKKRKAARKK